MAGTSGRLAGNRRVSGRRYLLAVVVVVTAIAALVQVGMSRAQQPIAKAPAAAGSGAYAIGDRLPQEAGKSSGARGGFREVTWFDLAPSDWRPMDVLKGLDLASLSDSDPRAIQAMERIRTEWKKAPTNPAINNTAIRLPGFIVPLEMSGEAIREFLLVPSFGSCIHTPPPPANQIVHVTLDKPLDGFGMMDAVWVSGNIVIAKSDTEMGTANYRMRGVRVEGYQQRPAGNRP